MTLFERDDDGPVMNWLGVFAKERMLYALVKVDTAVGELAEGSLGLEGYTTATVSADILSSTAPLCGLSTGFSSIS